MTAGSLRYVPGAAIAVVHQQTAVLLDLDGGDPIVGRISALIESGGGVDEVLDVLVSSGLKSLVDFGAFQVTAAGVRLVVRGKVTGTVGDLIGLNAEHTMWHDTWQPEVSTAALELSGTPTGPQFVIKSGVVLASGVAYSGSAGSSQLADPAERETQAASTSTPKPMDSGPATVAPILPISQVAEASMPTPAAASQVSAAAPVERSAPVETSAPVPKLADADAVGGEPESDDFTHLFGLTQQPTPIEQPLPAALASDAEAERLRPADAGATMAAPLTIPAADLPEAAIPPEVAPPQLITGMPWATAAAPAVSSPMPQPAQPAAEPFWAEAQPPSAPAGAPVLAFLEPGATEAAFPTGLTPGRTVSRASLVGLSAVVMVVAARCPVGHLSPAYADTCRVCTAPLPQQQPVEVPRPTLGQLRLSTGGVVALDRPLILGRNPTIPAGYASEQPNLVRIPDPNKDVSGQHLEVSLDYWNVVVRDLGSTNGTEVILPGELPMALRTNDPVIIEPGTRVVLAGTVSFIFEVLS